MCIRDRGMVAAERVFKILDTESSINDIGVKIADSIKGEIRYKHVFFSYNKSEKVIENFNLKIQAGTTNAIVGATGSGKSTIIKLLNRFYNLDKGGYLIKVTRSQNFLIQK